MTAELHQHIAELETEVDRLTSELEAANVGRSDPADLATFVVQNLRPRLTEQATARTPAPWCDQWESHPLLSYLFGVAHRSWAEIDGPADEVSWCTWVLYPLLSMLRDPVRSPIAQCSANHCGVSQPL